MTRQAGIALTIAGLMTTVTGCGGGGNTVEAVAPVKAAPTYNPPSNHPLKDVTLENESDNMAKIKQTTGIPEKKR